MIEFGSEHISVENWEKKYDAFTTPAQNLAEIARWLEVGGQILYYDNAEDIPEAPYVSDVILSSTNFRNGFTLNGTPLDPEDYYLIIEHVDYERSLEMLDEIDEILQF